MGAALVLEDRVGAVALHTVDAFLYPTALRRAGLELLPAVAAPLRVSLEHPAEIAGPERGLVSADALPNLDDHVLLVGGVALDERELQLLLEPDDLGLVVGDHLGELGVTAGSVEVGARLPPGLCKTMGRLELLEA